MILDYKTERRRVTEENGGSQDLHRVGAEISMVYNLLGSVQKRHTCEDNGMS